MLPTLKIGRFDVERDGLLQTNNCRLCGWAGDRHHVGGDGKNDVFREERTRHLFYCPRSNFDYYDYPPGEPEKLRFVPVRSVPHSVFENIMWHPPSDTPRAFRATQLRVQEAFFARLVRTPRRRPGE